MKTTLMEQSQQIENQGAFLVQNHGTSPARRTTNLSSGLACGVPGTLSAETLGGPIQYFEVAGRKLLMLLLNEGLLPDSKVLDIGCGCLRGGYWYAIALTGSKQSAHDGG